MLRFITISIMKDILKLKHPKNKNAQLLYLNGSKFVPKSFMHTRAFSRDHFTLTRPSEFLGPLHSATIR